MANVFNSDVHKQQYDEGVMAELRDSIPMNSVSKVRSDNVEYIFNRYGDDGSATNSSDGTYNVEDATYTADSKLIDKEATRAHRIRYKEMAREGFDIAVDLADRHGFAMAEAIHRNATTVAASLANGIVDNEVIAGSASALTPISGSSSNPDEVGASIIQALQEANAYGEGTPFIMMSPKQAKNFNLYSMGAGFEVADSSLRDGLFRVNRGSLFGLDTIVTNEVERFRKLTLTGAAVADDTVTITVNGTAIVWTAKAAPDEAGEFDVALSAAAQATIIANMINGAATGQDSASGYYEVTAANRKLLKDAGVRATVDDDEVTIYAFRAVTIAEGLTNGSLGTYTEQVLAGIRNAVEIVLPSNGYHSEEKSVTGFNGIELVTTQIHDAHVFYKNRDKLLRVLYAA